MGASVIRKSLGVGLIGAVISAIYTFLRVGSDDGYVGIISGLAAFTGFVVFTALTMIILFVKARNQKLSLPFLMVAIVVAVILLFGVAQIWF